MKQFEYKKIVITEEPTTIALNKLGCEGWELVVEFKYVWIFKREIEKSYPGIESVEAMDIFEDLVIDHFKDVKIEDEVYIDCDSSFGADRCGWYPVRSLRERFDERTGESYNQLKVDGQWFHGITGHPIDEPIAYYLSNKKVK